MTAAIFKLYAVLVFVGIPGECEIPNTELGRASRSYTNALYTTALLFLQILNAQVLTT